MLREGKEVAVNWPIVYIITKKLVYLKPGKHVTHNILHQNKGRKKKKNPHTIPKAISFNGDCQM